MTELVFLPTNKGQNSLCFLFHCNIQRELASQLVKPCGNFSYLLPLDILIDHENTLLVELPPQPYVFS